MSALQRVREALTSRGSKVESLTPDRFVAQCPTHEDRRPSLSVRQGDRGVLLHCFAGCENKDITKDLGLKAQDLFDVDRVDYRYRDREGKTVRTVRRTPGKSFPQSGKAKWEKGTAPLYRLPEVVQAVKDGTTVYVCEGEKDAESLLLAGVECSTTSAQGVDSWTLTDWTPLAGAEVVLIPDNDKSGEKYREEVTAHLLSLGASVSVRRVKAGKDFSDHYAAGYGVEDLEEAAVSQERQEDREEEQDDWEIIAVPYSQIRMKRLHWLWDRRIEKGGLTVVGGVPGLGKSTICCYLCALVTRGELEGESFGTPGTVIWVTGEESKESAIKPRLLAAGADVDRVYDLQVRSTFQDGIEREVILPQDVDRLRRLIEQTGASLVVIDPLVSVMDGKTDSHNDHKVRQALGPVNRLAIETETAIVGIMHERKGKGGTYLERLIGSTGFGGLARSVLAVLKDPDDPEEQRLCVGVAKTNNAKTAATLSFVLESCTVQEAGETSEVGKAVCLGEVSSSVHDLMSASDDHSDREERDEAEDWLRSYLEDRGGEAPASDIKRDCARDGISFDVLKKRKKRLGIRSEKSGYQSRSMWVLPEAQTSQESPAGSGDREDDRGQSAALSSVCEVRECDSLAANVVPLDGHRWSLCSDHCTDPALSLILGGQDRLEGLA